MPMPTQPPTPDEDALPPPPWVVAVGASAGGLEALQAFFADIGPGSQAAFVVIQHLSPDHRSMMSELLGRHCALPVREAVAGERLLPDRIHLMPAGVLMTVQDEHLHFQPRPVHGVSLPIDGFLMSLADTIPARSIAVVLSGTGSDGAAGAAALHAAGGHVMVQAPGTAKFDSMPRSVAAATQVDVSLPPQDLARRVLALTRGDAPSSTSGEVLEATRIKPALQAIFDTLRQACGVDFGQYKPATVLRRIERRLAALDCASPTDYAAIVMASPDECEALRRELLIPVTGFFRDPAAFESLGQVLQGLLQQQPLHQPLRLWCAGCATGEEAYSLAITALQACHAVGRWPGIKVFATDIDDRVLTAAGTGSYPVAAADALGEDHVAAYFNRQGDRLVVKPELRQMVLFARHNLLEDPPFTKLDLVACRNTLIYLQVDAQERVLRRLQYALNPAGLLLLGSSESLGALQADFSVVDAHHKIYRIARPVLHTLSMQRPGNWSGRAAPSRSRGATALMAAQQPPSLVEQGQMLLAQAYMPVSLLVNAQRQLLHAWGATERFLRLPPGQVQLDVVRLLPANLGAAVANAISQSVRERRPYQSPAIAVDLPDGAGRVRVVSRPLPGDETGADPFVVVSLEPVPGVDTAAVAPRPPGAVDHDRVDALERDLADTRATLQANIHDLETTNEELQVANEELMSSNEELQSANEELQSLNEELYTVNAEYNAKLDLVNALNADLDGMSRATGIATLFVDAALRLVRFTPEATLLFRLRPDDTGRSITDFSCQLEYPELATDLQRALDRTTPVERELMGPGGARYLARVLGYGDAAAGRRRAVLSLIDVSRLHDAQRLQRLLDALPEHVAMLDGKGQIQQVNRAWSLFAHANTPPPHDAAVGIGVNYLEVLARATTADAGDVLRGVQQVLAGVLPHFRVVYPCHSPTERRWFAMTASPLLASPDRLPQGAVITHVNITPWVEGVRPDDGMPGAQA